MTFAEIADHYAPKPDDIIGPYSPWPRRRRRGNSRTIGFTSNPTAAGVLVHLGVPLAF